MSQSNDFDGGPGKVHPKQRRSAGLPSDCECHVCDGVIEHDEQCFKLRRSYNAHGEVDTLASDDGIIICAECGRELLE